LLSLAPYIAQHFGLPAMEDVKELAFLALLENDGLRREFLPLQLASDLQNLIVGQALEEVDGLQARQVGLGVVHCGNSSTRGSVLHIPWL